jgi:TonB family protein
MSDKENNIIYNARDIEQYLAGKLSAQQMHAMEKAALDDSFLAEAMEGYEAVKDKEWNNQLATLREQISSKGTIAKVIPLHKSKNNWWKAAAAVFIVAAGTTLTLIFNKDKKDQGSRAEIAQVTPNILDTATQLETVTTTTSVTQSLNPNATASSEYKKTIPGTIAQVNEVNSKAESNITLDPNAPVLNPAAPVATGTNLDDRVIVTAPVQATENADIKDINAEKSKSAAKQTSEAEAVLYRPKNQQPAVAKKEAVLNNFFTAQIVASDNTPLPFTNISIKKENFGTYADSKGVVRLVSTDSILNIEVKSVGYQPKIFALHNNQVQTKIILQEEEIALRDKKIIGNTSKSSVQPSHRARLLKDSAVNVEPADGWDNYDTYVANNLDIPESALKVDRHGEVEITFDVKSNGTISNIRINKSLGAEYDEAAKRLIQEGPQWKVKKGRKTTASVKVQF